MQWIWYVDDIESIELFVFSEQIEFDGELIFSDIKCLTVINSGSLINRTARAVRRAYPISLFHLSVGLKIYFLILTFLNFYLFRTLMSCFAN